MNDQKYNGWTNYETWNVKLWMDNDEGSYNYYREVARNALHMAVAKSWQTEAEAATYDLSEVIKSDFEEGNPLADACNTYSDLLGAALSSVNWYEIAASLIEAEQEVACA